MRTTSAMNDGIRLVGQEVLVVKNGCRVAGRLLSSGNHGVVVDVNGMRRTFAGRVDVRPIAA